MRRRGIPVLGELMTVISHFRELEVLRKIAIVGADASAWKKDDEKRVKEIIDGIFSQYYPSEVMLVSGRCPKGGVDIWAEEIANEYNIPTMIFPAQENKWIADDEAYDGYKKRNIKIAENCDIIYCFALWMPKSKCYHCGEHGHKRNGGCWTMKWAKNLDKEVELILV